MTWIACQMGKVKESFYLNGNKGEKNMISAIDRASCHLLHKTPYSEMDNRLYTVGRGCRRTVREGIFIELAFYWSAKLAGASIIAMAKRSWNSGRLASSTSRASAAIRSARWRS